MIVKKNECSKINDCTDPYETSLLKYIKTGIKIARRQNCTKILLHEGPILHESKKNGKKNHKKKR